MNGKGYMNSPTAHYQWAPPAESRRKRDASQGLAHRTASGQATILVADLLLLGEGDRLQLRK